MREFVRHGALVFAGMVSANALTYVSYAEIARAVGVESAGLFTALISAVLFLSLPSNVAATVVARVGAASRARGDLGIVRYLGMVATRAVVPIGAIALLVATFGNRPIGSFFHTSDAIVIAAWAAVLTFTFPLALQRAVMQGAADFRAFTVSNVIEGLGKALTGAGALLAGGGLRAILGGYAVTAAATFAANAFAVRGGTAVARRPRPQSAEVLRHVVGIALPIVALTAVTFADTVLVRHYLAPVDAGLYGAAALVGRAILTVIQFVPTVLMPRATAASVAGHSPAPFLIAAMSATACAVAAILLAVGAAPELAVRAVAGVHFTSAAPLVFPYAVAMAALACATVLASYLIAIGRARFALPLVACAALEIVAVAFVHPNGAAVVRIVLAGHVATLVCCLPEAILSLWAGRRGAGEGLAASTAEGDTP